VALANKMARIASRSWPEVIVIERHRLLRRSEGLGNDELGGRRGRQRIARVVMARCETVEAGLGKPAMVNGPQLPDFLIGTQSADHIRAGGIATGRTHDLYPTASCTPDFSCNERDIVPARHLRHLCARGIGFPADPPLGFIAPPASALDPDADINRRTWLGRHYHLEEFGSSGLACTVSGPLLELMKLKRLTRRSRAHRRFTVSGHR
jgi:hypothetical protein